METILTDLYTILFKYWGKKHSLCGIENGVRE